MARSTKSSSSPKPNGKLRYDHVSFPTAFAILFGVWVCFWAGSGAPMPYSSLEILKDLGLLIFRSEGGLQILFGLTVLVHVIEAALAYSVAEGLQAGRGINKSNYFTAFWVVQVLFFGFPAFRLLRRQVSEQAASRR